jgi:hypothetical protein
MGLERLGENRRAKKELEDKERDTDPYRRSR